MERAKAYRPSGRRQQISTLGYFDGAVRDEHDKARAAISPDAPARQIGAELPQHHGSRTAAGLERPGQSIRDERREQEDRERAQDESVASW
jgi:hypothetical protein